MKFVNKEFIQVEGKMQSVLYKVPINSFRCAMVALRANLAFVVSVVSQHIFQVGPL